MNVALQEFLKSDNGFGQYAERYEDVSSDIAVRRMFAAWTAEMDKLDIWKAIGRAEGRAEGKAEGRAEGKAEGKLEGKLEKAIEAAKRMLEKGISIEITADCQDLPLSQVQELASQIVTFSPQRPG